MTPATLRKARLLGRSSGLVALILTLGACPPMGAGIGTSPFNPNETIGFPTTTAAVTIDGIAGAAEWNRSFKFYLEDGAAVSRAYMRGMADANNVYLYFDAEDPDGSFDGYDAVVLAANPSGRVDDFKRIHIYPCGNVCGSTGTSTGFAPLVEYKSGSLAGGTVAWASGVTAGLPPGVVIRSNIAPGGSVGAPGRWTVEIQIPRNATYAFPATGTFGMFADVIAVNSGSGDASQSSWPLGSFIGSNPNDVAGTIPGAPLPLPRWGNGTLDTSTFPAGLQITGFGNIGTNPSLISLPGPNDFIVTAANYPNGNGTEPPVTNVTATFKLSNFGLNPFAWHSIPSATNPTPPEIIDPLEYKAFNSGNWIPSDTNLWPGESLSELDFFTANPHQCVLVELHYSGGGGSISRQYNMDFATVNSPFELRPVIATGAWRKYFPRAKAVQLQEMFFNVAPGFTWESRIGGATPAGEHRWQLTSLARRSEKVSSSILPSPTLRLPSREYQLDPVALSKGASMDIEVRPGTVMTLITDGGATSGGARYTAAGIIGPATRRNLEPRRDLETRGDLETRRDLQARSDTLAIGQNTTFGYSNFRADGTKAIADVLRPGATIPEGALLASFDGFHTAFAIGTGTTMFVPYSAQKLSVRFAPGVEFDSGRFVLQAVTTDPTPVALDGRSLEFLRGVRVPILLPLGNNLPMYTVRGTVDTGTVIRIRDRQFRSGVMIGSYGGLIRQVNGPHARAGAPRRPIGTASLRSRHR